MNQYQCIYHNKRQKFKQLEASSQKVLHPARKCKWYHKIYSYGEGEGGGRLYSCRPDLRHESGTQLSHNRLSHSKYVRSDQIVHTNPNIFTGRLAESGMITYSYPEA